MSDPQPNMQAWNLLASKIMLNKEIMKLAVLQNHIQKRPETEHDSEADLQS